jgi:hypothetical protein
MQAPLENLANREARIWYGHRPTLCLTVDAAVASVQLGYGRVLTARVIV